MNGVRNKMFWVNFFYYHGYEYCIDAIEKFKTTYIAKFLYM